MGVQLASLLDLNFEIYVMRSEIEICEEPYWNLEQTMQCNKECT